MPDIVTTERDSKLLTYYLGWINREYATHRSYPDPIEAFIRSPEYFLFRALNDKVGTNGDEARHCGPNF